MAPRPKLLGEVSDEALRELFEPGYAMDLNVPLSEHVLRLLAFEHLRRGGERTEPVEEALTGPGRCRHGRDRMGTCPACEDEDTPQDDPEGELRAFCDAYRAGEPFARKRLYEALAGLGYALRKHDPGHDQEAACARASCGHPYHRHFDPYDDDREVGCKYCPCEAFVEPTKRAEGPGPGEVQSHDPVHFAPCPSVGPP